MGNGRGRKDGRILLIVGCTVGISSVATVVPTPIRLGVLIVGVVVAARLTDWSGLWRIVSKGSEKT